MRGNGHARFQYLSFLFVWLVWFFETGFFCGSGYPGTYFIDQPALLLTEIRVPLPPKCWD